jgi:hypothetical protein
VHPLSKRGDIRPDLEPGLPDELVKLGENLLAASPQPDEDYVAALRARLKDKGADASEDEEDDPPSEEDATPS